jgi:hypothetical protein
MAEAAQELPPLILEKMPNELRLMTFRNFSGHFAALLMAYWI